MSEFQLYFERGVYVDEVGAVVPPKDSFRVVELGALSCGLVWSGYVAVFCGTYVNSVVNPRVVSRSFWEDVFFFDGLTYCVFFSFTYGEGLVFSSVEEGGGEVKSVGLCYVFVFCSSF